MTYLFEINYLEKILGEKMKNVHTLNNDEYFFESRLLQNVKRQIKRQLDNNSVHSKCEYI